jgi:hypothetical protein
MPRQAGPCRSCRTLARMFRALVVALFLWLFGAVSPALALGWEQIEYLSIEPTGSVTKLSFDPSPAEERKGMMVYRAKNAGVRAYCLAERARLGQPVQLRCMGGASDAHAVRLYKPLASTKPGEREARRIYKQFLAGRKVCGTGAYAGYLTCVQGCETHPAKVLPKIEHTECVGHADAR